MQIVDLERENSTSKRFDKDKSSVDPAELKSSSLEAGIARVSALYAALAGFLLRGGEGLSDRRAERRYRQAAKNVARNPAGPLPTADR